MKLAGLSPEAHGTLRALRNLARLRAFEITAADELIRGKYAEIRSENGLPTLRITQAGIAAPLDSAEGRPLS